MSELSNLSPTLPPVGTVAVVPGSPGGVGADTMSPQIVPVTVGPPAAPTGSVGGGGGNVAPVSADDPQVVALLQQLTATVGRLIAIASAQAGATAATGVTGGGAVVNDVVAPESLRAAAGGNGSGLGGGASWDGAYTLEPVMATVAGGGAVAGGGGASAGPSLEQQLSGSSLGGYSGTGWSIEGGGGGAAQAAASGAAVEAAPVAGGGPTVQPTIDMRRVVGTPQPGGVIDTIMRSAMVNASDSKNEGEWMNITDGNGAVMQVHVHGAWATHQDQIVQGIQQGSIHVHLHPDGTLHLHDVV